MNSATQPCVSPQRNQDGVTTTVVPANLAIVEVSWIFPNEKEFKLAGSNPKAWLRRRISRSQFMPALPP